MMTIFKTKWKKKVKLFCAEKREKSLLQLLHTLLRDRQSPRKKNKKWIIMLSDKRKLSHRRCLRST
jgi:hypothetical protein